MRTPNKDNIRKWVAALRSGDYKQAKGVLKRDDAYCCLGVACDISGLGGWVTDSDDPDREVFAVDGGQSHYALPPDEVMNDFLGLSLINPTLRMDDGVTTQAAAVLNDTFDYSFDQIADAIERTFLADDEPAEPKLIGI